MTQSAADDCINYPTRKENTHPPLRIADLLSGTNSATESGISECVLDCGRTHTPKILKEDAQKLSHGNGMVPKGAELSNSRTRVKRERHTGGLSGDFGTGKPIGRKRSCSSAKSSPPKLLQPKLLCRSGFSSSSQRKTFGSLIGLETIRLTFLQNHIATWHPNRIMSE